MILGLLAAAGPSAAAADGFAVAGAGPVQGLPPGCRLEAGPTAQAPAVVADAGDLPLARVLDEELPGRGSVMFWFRADRPYRSGKDAVARTQPLVDVPGTLAIRFLADKTSVTLAVQWEGRAQDVAGRQIRIILPEFPGQEWHHFALHWDGATGSVNAFVDGTPYLIEGEQLRPWRIAAGRRIVVHASRFALADVRVSPAPFDRAQLRTVVGAAHWGALDRLLGARPLPGFAPDQHRGRTLYARTLAGPADTRGWVLEGPGNIEYQDGWMHLRSAQRNGGARGNFVYWCPAIFPDHIMAEWDFDLIGPKGLCIVFFAARGRNGRDLFDPGLAPRDGLFAQYTAGDIDCYHISYFADTPNEPRPVANLRKNPGFYLISNGPVGVPQVRPGEVHHAWLVKEAGRIRMAVDGRTIIDHLDDGARAGPVWTDGRIGLRQMQWTVARYRNFRVSALR